MKKTRKRTLTLDQDEMLPEYDLRTAKGIRGKYYQAMRQGYRITVHRKDGTTLVKEVKPKDTILLEPDVQEYFPDSKSVNTALRSVIASVPLKRTIRKGEAQRAYGLRQVAKTKRPNH
jgi:hypothetical protein